MSSGETAAAARLLSSMEEDRAANLVLASELAPRLCRGCERYHLRYIARRAVQGPERDSLDKPVTIRILGELLAARRPQASGWIDIVIAGAADSGTLATAAAAAFQAGELDRCRFRVLDRCPTPLALCEAYGRDKAVEVTTRSEDLLADTLPHPADFVLVHSLFRHIPPDRHVELMRRFTSWLKPGGRILFSVLVEPPGTERPSSTPVMEGLRAMLEAGTLSVAEPVEAFMARVEGETGRERDHAAALAETESILALFARSALKVEAYEEIDGLWGQGIPGMTVMPRRRAFAVLAP
ncbi:MAG: class I SAM-dependent methyltransferase [Bauldia sp.]|nr:class I SAM-dependent methyltransferase [Bauldia sp.]